MLKVDRALQEVWDWKESIYNELDKPTIHELVELIKAQAAEVKEKYHLELKKYQPHKV